MAPFKVLTDGIEGDTYETLLMVWPITMKLHRILADDDEADNDTVFIKKMKVIGRKYMETNASDFKPTFLHRAATVLHPEMRKLLAFNSLDRDETYKEIEDYLASSSSNQLNSSEGT